MIYVALVYGLLSLVGGIIGYLKVGSMASLIAGSVSGILILGSVFLLWKGNAVGYYVILAVSVLLGLFFAKGFFASYKVFPAGVMLALSVITLVGFLLNRAVLLHLQK